MQNAIAASISLEIAADKHKNAAGEWAVFIRQLTDISVLLCHGCSCISSGYVIT